MELVHEITVDGEFRSLEIDLILECRVVSEGYFFIKFFLADTILLLEGIERMDRKGDVRQGNGITRITGILAVEGVDREVILSVPVMGIRDGR